MRNIGIFLVIHSAGMFVCLIMAAFSFYADAASVGYVFGGLSLAFGFTFKWLSSERTAQRKRSINAKRPARSSFFTTLTETQNVVEAATLAGRCSPDLARRLMDITDRLAHRSPNSPLRSTDSDVA